MDIEYWLERWKSNQIGFHMDEVNPRLQHFSEYLGLTPGDRVFVPLCGKTQDMMWLQRSGFDVIGNEASEVGVLAFFQDQHIPYQRQFKPPFVQYVSERIQIYQGDFFLLETSMLTQIKAVYDRASLIALPIEQRPAYVQHLLQLLPNRPKILLITLEYDMNDMEGPPFSVTQSEVTALFSNDYDIQRLQSEDILEKEPHFKEKGLSHLVETTYLLSVPI